MSLARPLLTTILLVLALPLAANARTHETFYGWSPDGTFYVVAYAGTDEWDMPSVCLSDARAGSPSWPKAKPLPEDGDCTEVCPVLEDAGLSPICDHDSARAKTWVKLPASAKKGPHGEVITLKVVKDNATVTVLAGGRKLAESRLDLDRPDDKPILREIYWRPDGKAVAVQVGFPDRDPNDETPGWGPPLYLAMLFWGQSAPSVLVGRPGAEAANARGMKLLRARNFAGAAGEFRNAVIMDASYILPHYNLACAAARAGDKKAAIAELRWLAASPDPAARSAMRKAPSDPDLRSVAAEPEVKKLFEATAGSCEDTCDDEKERCEKRCPDDENVRGCSRLCSGQSLVCAEQCEKKPSPR